MAFVASSSLAGAATGTMNVPVPAGTAAGQIAVVAVYTEGSTGVTPPAGFVFRGEIGLRSPVTTGRVAVFWKRLTGADSGTWVFTTLTATWTAAVAGLWSGRAAAGDPWADWEAVEPAAAGTTTPAVSAAARDSGGDGVFAGSSFVGTGTWTPPGSWTERVDQPTLTLATRDNLGAGGTGTVQATSSVSTWLQGWLGVLAADVTGVTVPFDDAAFDSAAFDTGGGSSQALSTATETDTALSAARAKRAPSGVATETNTAIPAARTKRRTAGAAGEADTTPAVVGRRKVKTLTAAVDAQTALGATRRKARTIGTAAEADTAQPVTRVTPALGTAAETDVAQPAGRHETRTVGTATEADTAPTLARRKTRALATAPESDAAQPAGRRKARNAGTASEVDAALPVAHPGAQTVGRAGEADAALPISARKRRTVILAAEVDQAVALGRTHARTLGATGEVDTGRPVGPGRRLALGTAAEVDVAGQLTGLGRDTRILAVRERTRPAVMTERDRTVIVTERPQRQLAYTERTRGSIRERARAVTITERSQ